MVSKEASDLFITAGAPPCIKVNGMLQPVTTTPMNAQSSQELIYHLLTPEQKETFEKEHECNFSFSLGELGRFRASIYQQRDNTGMVLRRIETEIPTLKSLGLPEVLECLAMAKRGLVIFVGATSSGKSSSLAAFVDHRNRHGNGHILTVEDPIEFLYSHKRCLVSQREVGVDTDSFQIGLRNALRQAPDMMVIGEIRSRETMEYALEFSETGHLCVATMHANNANQAIERIINLLPEDRHRAVRMELALNLRAIVAQQLLPDPEGGPSHLAMEVLVNTALVSDYIRKGQFHELKQVMSRSSDSGMKTFDQSLFELFSQGKISQESALEFSESPNDLRLMIKFHKHEVRDKKAKQRAAQDPSRNPDDDMSLTR